VGTEIENKIPNVVRLSGDDRNENAFEEIKDLLRSKY